MIRGISLVSFSPNQVDKYLSKDTEHHDLVMIDKHTVIPWQYRTFTVLNSILAVIIIFVVKQIFRETNITSYEIVYVKSAASTFFLFAYLLISGIYILDVENHLRRPVIARGILILLGMTMFYASVHNFNCLSTALITQFTALGLTHYVTLGTS